MPQVIVAKGILSPLILLYLLFLLNAILQIDKMIVTFFIHSYVYFAHGIPATKFRKYEFFHEIIC